MISPLQIQSLAEFSAAHIAASLVEGTLIALCAALALRLGCRQNSSTRFAIWFSALITIAALPFLAGALSGIGTLHGPAPLHPPVITLPTTWAIYLFAAWAFLALLSLSRVVISLIHVRALRKSCVPTDPAQLDPRIRETLSNTTTHVGTAALGCPVERSSTAIALCTSDQVQVPTAIGFFRPAVVIPSWLLDDLLPEQLHQIVLHELAHLRRHDDWTNLAQQFVKALFFFHPAVWWIEKKIALEREMACDDAVLAATAEPRAYAECLAHLAERTLIRRNLIQRGIELAQAAIGRLRHTSLRVAQILDPNRKQATRHSWKPALSLMAAIAVGSVSLASREPQLIAFRDSSARFAPEIATNAVCGNSHVGTAAPSCPVERSSTVIDSSVNSPLKPINASYIAPPSPAKKQGHLTRKQPIVPASNPATATRLALNQPASAAAQPSDAQIFAFVITSETLNPTLVHPANLVGNSAVSSETIFVIVQNPGTNATLAGQPIIQIHFWRVTVFHPTQPGATKTPNKET